MTTYDAPAARDVPSILRAGDVLRLRRGATYGPLRLQGEGTAGKRVTIGAYGTGPLPVVQGLEVAVPYCTVYDVNGRGAWAGLSVTAPNVTLSRVAAGGNSRGIHVNGDYCTIRSAVLDGNDVMSVNTPTPKTDDSGAFGLAIYQAKGCDVDQLTVRGSYADSYDFGHDGSAVELYDATDAILRRVRSFDCETGIELGGKTTNTQLEDWFVFGSAAQMKGLVTRGAGDREFGPVLGTKVSRLAVSLTGAGSAGVVASGGATPDVLAIADSVIVAETALWTDGPISESNVRWVGRVTRP